MRRLLLCIASLVLVFAIGSVAEAKGTVRVQQSDGSTQVYSGVTLKIVGQTLRVTTADGLGTLVITKAACSFNGDLMSCLPYSLVLEQAGKDDTLDFANGTIYYNQTSGKLPLPLSSTQVPPNSIVGLLNTKKGTVIAITGAIDGKAQ